MISALIILVLIVVLGAIALIHSQMKQSFSQNENFRKDIYEKNDSFTKNFNEKLDYISSKMFQGMEKSTDKTSSTINKIHERLATLDKAQTNIENLSSQVESFKDILSNKKTRGTYGELQLQDVVASMLPPSAFTMQANLSNGKRVDCLIKMPAPHGDIAVDSKFPLENYQMLSNAKTDTEKQTFARQFELDIEKHIRDIAEKYLIQGETSDTAIMFIPSESIYAEIFTNFPRLVDKSFRAKVLLASPTTLMATLITVRAVFKDVKIQEQAKVIQKEIMILIEDLSRLDSRVSSLDTHFNQAQKDIEMIKTSSTKINSRGEKIISIEVKDEDKKKVS